MTPDDEECTRAEAVGLLGCCCVLALLLGGMVLYGLWSLSTL